MIIWLPFTNQVSDQDGLVLVRPLFVFFKLEADKFLYDITFLGTLPDGLVTMVIFMLCSASVLLSKQ